MKEFIEKLIGRLEEQAEQYRRRGFEYEEKGYSAMADKHYGKQCSYLHSIEIVTQLTEEYKSKTQADKIRSMSDEELAELFAQYSCEDADYTSLLPIKDCKYGTKQEVIDRNLKWLQSEAE